MIDFDLYEAKKLYPFQEQTVNQVLDELRKNGTNFNLLYQLPTGGGKTVIFSEIARRFIEQWNKKVLILTHRIELSVQTSKQLSAINVANKVINSEVKLLDDQDEYQCFIAMVETLNNRLNENDNFIADVGLVIVDEAHYNSFRKIFQFYEDANILGVTATPLSSNRNLPLKDNYNKLLVGESISNLIEGGYLSNAETYQYDVNLHGLKIGTNGDFTVSSSDLLYSNFFMQEKLIFAYEEVSLGKKTLIFNAGIETSRRVEESFKKLKYNIRHLDSTFSDKDRKDVIQWFKVTPGAILTSVGILTTGFDEPTVESIIINRATRSLTLYHQMIGRGSRKLPNKSEFQIIDLGNNVRRFGYWQDYINWQDAFKFPDRFLESRISELEDMEFEVEFEFPKGFDKHMPSAILEEFNIKDCYYECLDRGEKGKNAIDLSIENHFKAIESSAQNLDHALDLMHVIQDHIEHRLKHYTKCISKSTDNYFKYLLETYNRQLAQKIRLNIED
ncbi:MAG: DEAD/DEAH box helicase family protein [Crocinitomicaceae bacterium]|jgi:superfamily II DNA or RNA helicase|nr:DEAD/DEAH box helicase family protein [Crocinitomicaceae bacterium]MDP4761625.1 DEAD/DEAH box helicase family protein [Crocinitomicaceae bacterium]